MLTMYIVIYAVAMLMALPLGSRRIAYANTGVSAADYYALRGVHKSQRHVAYAAFGILFLLMVFVCANKSETIYDYQMYEYLYELNGSRNVHREMEVTYGIISKISPTFIVLLTIYAVLSCGTHIAAILKNSPNIALSVLAYFGYFFVVHDMIQIRAAVAIAIFLYAMRFISSRNWRAYFPLIMIAVLFHNSAIAYIPMYFLPRKHLNRYFWGGLLMASLVLGMAGFQFGMLSRYIPVEIVEKYLDTYLGNKNHEAVTNGPMRVIETLVGLWMIIKVRTYQKHYPYATVCVALYVLTQMCYLLFTDIPVLQIRMGELFGSVNIFTLAMFPMLSRKHYYVLMLVPIGIVAYRLGSTFYMLQGV